MIGRFRKVLLPLHHLLPLPVGKTDDEIVAEVDEALLRDASPFTAQSLRDLHDLLDKAPLRVDLSSIDPNLLADIVKYNEELVYGNRYDNG